VTNARCTPDSTPAKGEQVRDMPYA
jgi:hypothetical protein